MKKRKDPNEYRESVEHLLIGLFSIILLVVLLAFFVWPLNKVNVRYKVSVENKKETISIKEKEELISKSLESPEILARELLNAEKLKQNP